jgi:hypothetical protein
MAAISGSTPIQAGMLKAGLTAGLFCARCREIQQSPKRKPGAGAGLRLAKETEAQYLATTGPLNV